MCRLLNNKPPTPSKRSCSVLLCLHAMSAPAPDWGRAARQAEHMVAAAVGEGAEQRAGREPTPVAGAQAEEEMEGRTQGPVARPTREPTPTTGAEQRAGHEPMPVADNESDDLKVYDESIN